MITGVLIDPAERTLSPAQFEPGDLPKMYEMLGCDLVTLAYLDDSAAVFVDDEGLFKPDQSFFYHEPTGQFLAGKGLVVGPPDDEGESTSCPLSAEDLALQIDFGVPTRIGGLLMFIGDRNVREIR